MAKADPKTKLSGRLRKCMELGRLTVADLQHFFRRPYPTVRSWIVKEAIPRDPKTHQLLADLAKLEKLVHRRKGDLVPFDVLFVDRPAFMAKLNGHNQSASSARNPRRARPKKRAGKAKRSSARQPVKRATSKRKPARPKAGAGRGNGNRQIRRDSEPTIAAE